MESAKLAIKIASVHLNKRYKTILYVYIIYIYTDFPANASIFSIGIFGHSAGKQMGQWLRKNVSLLFFLISGG